jgi:hypothetical protein
VLFAVLVLLLHAVALGLRSQWWQLPGPELSESHRIFNIQEIRTLGAKDSNIKDKILVTKDLAKKPKQDPFAEIAKLNQPQNQKAVPQTQAQLEKSKLPTHPYRPDAPASAMEKLQMTAEPVSKVATRTAGGGAQLGGSQTLSQSLMNMQVELPEGVSIDELNEYELMFYGFQKRMMEKYFSSIVLNVRDYEKKYSLRVLIPEGSHTMTGRVTFDSDGNIKQIKMIRWTQADKLQAMFEDILKSMHTLPNPPKMLRNSNGEFVVYYSFIVNNI